MDEKCLLFEFLHYFQGRRRGGYKTNDYILYNHQGINYDKGNLKESFSSLTKSSGKIFNRKFNLTLDIDEKFPLTGTDTSLILITTSSTIC